MNERQVAKDALKKEYLNEIAQELNKEAKRVDAITVDDKGNLILGLAVQDPNTLAGLVRYAATRLADAKAELWLQTQLTESIK